MSKKNKSILDSFFNEKNPEIKDSLKEEFIETNEFLVKRIIERKFASFSSRYDDLMQEGRLALSKAIDRFDPEKGQISTFCYHAVTNRLRSYVQGVRIFGKKKTYNGPIENSSEFLESIPVTDRRYKSVLEEVMDDLSEEDREVIRHRFGFDGNRKVGPISTKEMEAWNRLKEKIQESGYSRSELLQDA